MGEKITVVVVWGEAAAGLYDNDGERSEARLNEEGLVERYTFATEAEANAFRLGVAEADGWMGCSLLDEDDLT